MNRRFALPTAGVLIFGFSAVFLPTVMKHSIDSGLTGDAKAALTSKSVSGVAVNSNWASLTLKGQASQKAPALAAVHKMGNFGAVNAVNYICTGPVPCPAGSNGAAGANGSGASAGTASGSGGAGASGAGASGAGSSGSGSAGSGANAGAGASPSAAATGVSTPAPGSAAAKQKATNINAEISKTLSATGVTFDNGSSTLTSQGRSVLDHVASLLNQAPNLKVKIAGYTDNTGSASINQSLSQARAKSTMSYLASHGVGANRMSAAGYGEANPVASNATAGGRAKNRRIVFTVQGG